MSGRATCDYCGLTYLPRSDRKCPSCGAYAGPGPFESSAPASPPSSGPSANPFASPQAELAPSPSFGLVKEGSMGLGIALGFILGFWGLLGCLVFGKSETKKGAGIGFLSRIGVAVLFGIVMALFG